MRSRDEINADSKAAGGAGIDASGSLSLEVLLDIRDLQKAQLDIATKQARQKVKN